MRILHIAPQRPRKNGIADYAERYRELIHRNTCHLIEPVRYRDGAESCERSIRGLAALRRQCDQLLTELADGRYDLVHAEIGVACYPEFFLMAYLSARKAAVPLVVTFHDPPHLVLHPIQHLGLAGGALYLRGLKKAVGLLVSYPLEALILRECRFIFVLSEYGRRLAARRFPRSRAKMVPLAHFAFGDEPRGQMPTSDGSERIVLSAGFWTPRRRVETLLDALGIIRRDHVDLLRDWQFALAGGILDDPTSRGYFSSIKQRIATERWGRTITLYQDLPIADYTGLFRKAAIYVSTDSARKKKGAPASGNLLRAIGAGCALVVPDLRGIGDYVEHGVNGYIYSSDSAVELARCLQELLQSGGTVETQRQRNRTLARDRYNGDTIVRAFANIYEQCSPPARAPHSASCRKAPGL